MALRRLSMSHNASPRRCIFLSKRSNGWWNSELRGPRSACQWVRQTTQAGRIELVQKSMHLGKREKMTFHFAFMVYFSCWPSSRAKWNALGSSTLWRMARGRSSPQIICPLVENHLGLLPQQEIGADTFQRYLNVRAILEIATDELLEICSWVRYNKALGLGGIPNRARNLAIKSSSDMFDEVFQVYISEGILSTAYKRWKIVLFPKAGKPHDGPFF